MVAILSNQRDVILDAVRQMYTEVATIPAREFHFPTGRRACEFVGYPPHALDSVPPAALESFAGVGYPFAAAVMRLGDVVLDVGSGSGTDLFIASGLVGPSGRVIGLDMTEAMRNKLCRIAALAGAGNLEVLAGNAEEIPVPSESIDVVTTNGVLNLVPDKAKAIGEIARVMRTGGRLQFADIVVNTLPSEACRSRPELWAECVVGATTADQYATLCESVGLRDVEVLSRFDYFSGSSSAETRKVAGSFGAHTVVMRAVKR